MQPHLLPCPSPAVLSKEIPGSFLLADASPERSRKNLQYLAERSFRGVHTSGAPYKTYYTTISSLKRRELISPCSFTTSPFSTSTVSHEESEVNEDTPQAPSKDVKEKNELILDIHLSPYDLMSANNFIAKFNLYSLEPDARHYVLVRVLISPM